MGPPGSPRPWLPPKPRTRQKRGGGGGSGTQKCVYQNHNAPNQHFLLSNFMFSHYEISVQGEGPEVGGAPPPMAVSRSNTFLPLPRAQCSPSEGGVGGGGGPGTQKKRKVCVPKTAQINISFRQISLFPTIKSGPGGGGVLDNNQTECHTGGVRPPPRPPPTPPTQGGALGQGGGIPSLRSCHILRTKVLRRMRDGSGRFSGLGDSSISVRLVSSLEYFGV